MTAYRVTEFTSEMPDKVAAACENIAGMIAKAGAETSDFVMMNGGKGMVNARCPSRVVMEAALPAYKEAFDALVTADIVDGSSVVSCTGDNVASF